MDLTTIFCPECGDQAVDEPPSNYVTPGLVPIYSHLSDGTPLCPVMTTQGYRPAEPVEHIGAGAS